MERQKCPMCDGYGWTVESDMDENGNQIPVQEQCEYCCANGWIYWDDDGDTTEE